jgi:dolichyl-phosphate beta-glucosyltransferase
MDQSVPPITRLAVFREPQDPADRPIAEERNCVDLCIVVPAYNEEARLPSTLESLQQYLEAWGVDYHVIVVDDGSQDGTSSVSDAFGSRFSTVTLQRNQGKGAAVRAGMLEAVGKVVAFMDADLPYELDSLRISYEIIQSGKTDAILGARDIEGAGCRVNRRMSRSFASVVFRSLSKYLISREVTDTQAGFKCFRAAACQRIFSLATLNSFAFDIEIVVLIRTLRIRFQRIPVTLINERASTLSLFRHALPMLVDMFRVRWNVWRGMYAETLLLHQADNANDDEAALATESTSKAAA